MPIRLESRGEMSRRMVYLTPLLAIALTLITGSVLFELLGFDAGEAMVT